MRLNFCRKIAPITALFFLSLTIGCGSKNVGPELTPVTGTVILNEKPLANADLLFIPIESTPGVGGQARTEDKGEFNVVYSRGGMGLPQGKYRVAVSYRLMPDGSPVPKDDTTPPIESPARETLPRKYSDYDSSQLEVVISPKKPVELKLVTKK